MKIKYDVLSEMSGFFCSLENESGCLLGSHDGTVIDTVIVDEGVSPDRFFYSPDIARLNIRLIEWNNDGISLMGIAHSHVYMNSDLSDYDKRYILYIMKCLSEDIKKLYFPIYVVPENKLVCYNAKNSNGVIIAKNDFTIVK